MWVNPVQRSCKKANRKILKLQDPNTHCAYVEKVYAYLTKVDVNHEPNYSQY